MGVLPARLGQVQTGMGKSAGYKGVGNQLFNYEQTDKIVKNSVISADCETYSPTSHPGGTPGQLFCLPSRPSG